MYTISDASAGQSFVVAWKQLEPMFDRALRHGQGDMISLEMIAKEVLEGDAQMWVVHQDQDVKAGIVVSVHQAAKTKVFVNVLAGSDMDEWFDLLMSKVSEFKDAVGASCIEASCRPGMALYLARNGWKSKATIMSI